MIMYQINNACQKVQKTTKSSVIYSQVTIPFIGYLALKKKSKKYAHQTLVIKPLGDVEEKFRSKEIHQRS